ncbi:MAG: hypothetical protein ACP5P3_07350 [Ignavibacteria bacterium]
MNYRNLNRWSGKTRLIILLLFVWFIIPAEVAMAQGSDTGATRKTPELPRVNPSPSGIFISPMLGIVFPIKAFKDNSKSALTYGIKLEFASLKLYPFTFGISYEHSSHSGSEELKTQYYLNSMTTKIDAFSFNVDFIVNKYLKSNFTIPFLTFDFKYSLIKRTIDPDISIPNINKSDEILTFSTGVGMTLYIFDIISFYQFAKDYPSFGFKTRFHFPLLKF